MSKNKKTIIDATTKTDDHMIHLEHQVDKNFDENYNYYNKNPFSRFSSRIVWWFVLIILYIVAKLKHGIKYKKNKAAKKMKKAGKGWVSIANHNLFLDCYIAVTVNLWKKTYIPTVEETMKMPALRHLFKAVNVVPIPTNPKGLVKFKNSINELLTAGEAVHFFPEGALWPFYNKLRPFKPGAFRFARENNVPILPFCLYFRPRRGLWKLIGKSPLVTIEILDPIYPDMEMPKKQAIALLSDTAYSRMNEIIERNFLDTDRYSFMDDSQKAAMGIEIPKLSQASPATDKADVTESPDITTAITDTATDNDKIDVVDTLTTVNNLDSADINNE